MHSRLSSLFAALLALLIALPAAAQDAWWDEDFGWRQEIEFLDPGISSDQSDFPLLVLLDSTRIDYNEAQPNGEDLRFVRDNGDDSFTVLDHEIEVWNDSGTSVVWVRLPTLDQAGSYSETFWIYWGDGDAPDGQNATAVWSAYHAVWHLQDTSASKGGADATLTEHGSIATTAGAIGDAYTFDGTDDYLEQTHDFTDWFDTADTSVEFWVRSTQNGDESNAHASPGIMGNDASGQDDLFFGWIKGGDESTRQICSSSGNSSGACQDLASGWHYLAFSVESTNEKFDAFLDGGGLTEDDGHNVTDAEAITDIGRIVDSSDPYFAGDLDELRIYDGKVDPDWVKANYLAQTDALIDWCGSGTNPAPALFPDFDGDGYGDETATAEYDCQQSSGLVADNTDCDDFASDLNPETEWYADVDGDGYGAGSVQFTQCDDPSDTESDYAPNALDNCDEDTPIGQNNWTSGGCDNCTDGDGDDWYVQCNQYDTIEGPDCNDSQEREWKQTTCDGNCADVDGDGHWSNCDAYPEAEDLCDDDSDPRWAHSWTSTACDDYPSITDDGVGCDDYDGDGAYSQCDAYDGQFLEDHCDNDGVATDEHSWTELACGLGCTDGDSETTCCADGDGDGFYSGCDTYDAATGDLDTDLAAFVQDFCDNDGVLIDEFNYTDVACNGGCDDLDLDGYYSGCDRYGTDLSHTTQTLEEDHCDETTDVGEHQWSAACAVCKDDDGDGYHTDCDAYDDGFQEDCEDGIFEVNPATTWYVDADYDGEADANQSTEGPTQCEDPTPSPEDCSAQAPIPDCNNPPAGAPTCYVYVVGDCDDCDGTLNSQTTWWPDDDGDEHGDFYGNSRNQCAEPSIGGISWVRNNDDCEDDNASVQLYTWYEDGDEDGYGSEVEGESIEACPTTEDGGIEGYVDTSTDCNDEDDTIHPGAPDDSEADGTCGDGVDADCDGIGGPQGDEDGDTVIFVDEDAAGADDCDLDSDGDGVPDEIEWAQDADDDRDTDGDGIKDIADPDDDGDGIPTADEDYENDGVGDGDPTNDDTDDDGVPDYLDADDDGDTIPTAAEDLDGDGDPTNDDADGDQVPNYLDDDDDDDGVPTAFEEAVGADPYHQDSDGDGVKDSTEWGVAFDDPTPRDFDGDGDPDIIDPDDDGDGLPTAVEPRTDIDGIPLGFGAGCELSPDGWPSYLDVDSDGDGVCDGTHETVLPEDDNPSAPEGCRHWTEVDRDPNTPGDQLLIEDLNPQHDEDSDGDGLLTVYDCDDYDGGLGDADGDGISTADENATCYDGGSICLDPSTPDTDGDGVWDDVEAGPDLDAIPDTDGDGIPDPWDLDDDGDGVPTLDEDYPQSDDEVAGDGDPTNDDTDGDDIPDYLDFDDDGDGIDTIDEDLNGNGDPRDDDGDADGVPNYLDDRHEDGPEGDMDFDGLTNAEEQAGDTDPTSPDTDGDGVLDVDEYGMDTDGDGTPDGNDPDDDGDGIPTWVEGYGDADGDGVPNYLDTDADGDEISDRAEGGDAYEAGGELPDSDGDGTADFLDAHHDVFGEPVDDGSPPPPPPDCACGTGSAPGGGLGALLLLAVAAVRRRRSERTGAARTGQGPAS